MKVIVTGSTGTVGSAVLQQCIENPAVTSVVALTRRPLEVKDPKLNNIIHKDFLNYDEEVLKQLKGAQACIWALGSPSSGKTVHIDYTMTAVNTFQKHLVPELKQGEKFRFVYTSGGAVPYLASSSLFFLGSWRTLRLDLDNDLLALEKQNADTWESYVARPWIVCDAKPMLGNLIDNSYIFRPELGAAMLDAALNGDEERVLSNTYMRSKGQAALDRSKL